MDGFLQTFRETKLGEIFGDQTPVSIDDAAVTWLERPSADLLSYARDRHHFPFEENPDDPVTFRAKTSILTSQIHRFSLSLNAICPHLPPDSADPILDLGAFPFTLDIAMREYLRVPHPIIATINQTLPGEWLACLDPYNLKLIS